MITMHTKKSHMKNTVKKLRTPKIAHIDKSAHRKIRTFLYGNLTFVAANIIFFMC